MTTTGISLEKNQKAERIWQRQASKASSLAGNRLLCGRAEICARLYRPRQGRQFCSPAKEISGGKVNARCAGRLIRSIVGQAAEVIARGGLWHLRQRAINFSSKRGRSIGVVRQLAKLQAGVRVPSAAPFFFPSPC